jgi:hypothetical protein
MVFWEGGFLRMRTLGWVWFSLGEKDKNIFEQTSFQSGGYMLPEGI